jgi:hypothetical protein
MVWAMIVFSMLTMGMYWSILSYNNWQKNQVLTTIATTAYPVKKIEFPAVTFCSPGVNQVSISPTFFDQLFGTKVQRIAFMCFSLW